MKARRAIGDDADTPRWIRTVHARGYRFIGEVRTAGDAAAAVRVRPALLQAMGVSPCESGDRPLPRAS